MNERIKELAKQAGDYVNEVYTPPARSKTPGKIWEDGHVDWHDQFHEKFAELIVRECMIPLLKESKWYWDKNEFESSNAIQNATRRLKEHFGVE